MNDDKSVTPLREYSEHSMTSNKTDKDTKETFTQATLAAVGCASWIGVVAALIGLFALVRAVFF